MGRGAALSGKRPRPVGCGLFAREGGAPLSMLLLRNENLQNLLKRTKEAAAAYIDTTDSPKLKGLTVAQLFGLEWESAPREQLNWRSRMNALFKGLDQYGIGLLITVDEVSASLDEMISFAATYQLFVREGKRVGLPMAGLPHQVSALLRNQTVSFLRRSVQVQRGVVLAQGDLGSRYSAAHGGCQQLRFPVPCKAGGTGNHRHARARKGRVRCAALQRVLAFQVCRSVASGTRSRQEGRPALP